MICKYEGIMLRGGVLLIGSLLWQDYLSLTNDNVRKNWRDNRLILKSKIGVKVPIRYGRKSNNGIYTMVFSNACSGDKLGTGFIIPFQKDNLTLDNLEEEAVELSHAEGMDGKFVAGNKKVWAILGILPNIQKLSAEKRAAIINHWKKNIVNEREFNYNDFKVGNEKSPILNDGIIDIPWPTAIDGNKQKEVDELDFILATVTKPTDYPDISNLVNSVQLDSSRKYFLNNSINGITTFQDLEIQDELNQTKFVS